MRLVQVTTIVLLVAATGVGAEDRQAEGVSKDSFVGFRHAVSIYVALQNRLRSEVPKQSVTSDTGRIMQVTDALAAGVIRARPQARQGDFFDRAATAEVKTKMQKMLGGTAVAAFLADLNDEPTFKGRPRLHLRYPKGTSMAVMPTRVLSVLPELPKGLEYRFVGRDLVLRDSDAELIIDFLPNALPAK